MKKLLILSLAGIMIISSVCTVMAYNNILPYAIDSGKIIFEQHGNHKSTNWNFDKISQIKNDYEKELKTLSSSEKSKTERKVALENAEKVIEALAAELYDQVPKTKTEEAQKKAQEIYVKEQSKKLGRMKKEIFPQDEEKELLENAASLKEGINFEKAVYQNSDDENSAIIIPILNRILAEAESLYSDVEAGKIKSLDEFKEKRDAIFELRTELEINAGIQHISENEI